LAFEVPDVELALGGCGDRTHRAAEMVGECLEKAELAGAGCRRIERGCDCAKKKVSDLE
jgi:hypothetical protein